MSLGLASPKNYCRLDNEEVKYDGGKLSVGGIVGITCACVGVAVLGGLMVRGYRLYNSGAETLTSWRQELASTVDGVGGLATPCHKITFDEGPGYRFFARKLEKWDSIGYSDIGYTLTFYHELF